MVTPVMKPAAWLLAREQGGAGHLGGVGEAPVRRVVDNLPAAFGELAGGLVLDQQPPILLGDDEAARWRYADAVRRILLGATPCQIDHSGLGASYAHTPDSGT